MCYSYTQVPGQTDEYLRTLCACLINNLGWNMQLAKFSSNVYFQGFTGDLNPECYSILKFKNSNNTKAGLYFSLEGRY